MTQLEKFALYVLHYMAVNDWGFEESEDFSEEALRLGLMLREEYDPKKHGEDCDAEPGVECWFLTPDILERMRFQCDEAGRVRDVSAIAAEAAERTGDNS